jgi:hypothetical protein
LLRVAPNSPAAPGSLVARAGPRLRSLFSRWLRWLLADALRSPDSRRLRCHIFHFEGMFLLNRMMVLPIHVPNFIVYPSPDFFARPELFIHPTQSKTNKDLPHEL